MCTRTPFNHACVKGRHLARAPTPHSDHRRARNGQALDWVRWQSDEVPPTVLQHHAVATHAADRQANRQKQEPREPHCATRVLGRRIPRRRGRRPCEVPLKRGVERMDAHGRAIASPSAHGRAIAVAQQSLYSRARRKSTSQIWGASSLGWRGRSGSFTPPGLDREGRACGGGNASGGAAFDKRGTPRTRTVRVGGFRQEAHARWAVRAAGDPEARHLRQHHLVRSLRAASRSRSTRSPYVPPPPQLAWHTSRTRSGPKQECAVVAARKALKWSGFNESRLHTRIVLRTRCARKHACTRIADGAASALAQPDLPPRLLRPPRRPLHCWHRPLSRHHQGTTP